MSKCKDCGQEIIWKEDNQGSKYPCDPDLVDLEDLDEGIRIVSEEGELIRCDYELMNSGVVGFVVHFDTCSKS